MSEKIAVYARISEDVLGLEKGVERQLREARDLVEQRGWTITAEYADNDISALHGAYRPKYQVLLEDAQQGKFTRIVAYQLSRLWRNRRERAEAIELLSKRRVSITLIKGNDIDLTTPMGRSFAAQTLEADTLESELKSERVASAALERAQAGQASGHVLYGWRRINEYGRSGKRISFHDELDPEQAAVVKEIVERLLARESVTKLAADLNKRKIAPPRMAAGREPKRGRPDTWSSSSVRSVAMRWANCGKRVHHRGREDGAAPASSLAADRHRGTADRAANAAQRPSTRHQQVRRSAAPPHIRRRHRSLRRVQGHPAGGPARWP